MEIDVCGSGLQPLISNTLYLPLQLGQIRVLEILASPEEETVHC
jgi:hypothetical protein